MWLLLWLCFGLNPTAEGFLEFAQSATSAWHFCGHVVLSCETGAMLQTCTALYFFLPSPFQIIKLAKSANSRGSARKSRTFETCAKWGADFAQCLCNMMPSLYRMHYTNAHEFMAAWWKRGFIVCTLRFVWIWKKEIQKKAEEKLCLSWGPRRAVPSNSLSFICTKISE